MRGLSLSFLHLLQVLLVFTAAVEANSHSHFTRRRHHAPAALLKRTTDAASPLALTNDAEANPANPSCPKRNYFKKLREAQITETLGEGLGLAVAVVNGTATFEPVEVTSTPVVGGGGGNSTATATTTGSGSASTSGAASETDADSTTTRGSSSGSPSGTGAGSSDHPAPTSSDNDDAPEPTSKPPSSGGGGGAISALFPAGRGSSSWSTSSQHPSPLDLADSTLRPFSVLRSTPHRYEAAPDGKRALVAHFPQGSYTFKHSPQGGFSFYAKGPGAVDLTQAREATLGYTVWFPDGFAFNKGGKLPGFYGGSSDGESTSCSGGRRSDACFSARMMWRTAGAGEFYTYLPPGASANRKVCSIPPFSECNEVYGASVGRGAFTFPTGRWAVVAERVRLNDVGRENGELELWVDGRSVVSVKGLVLRTSEAGRIRGVQFQTFFGGSKPDWASPKTQQIYFADFSVAVTETF